MGYFDHYKKEPEPRRPVNGAIPIDPERATRYAAKALESECEKVASAEEGHRNDILNIAAFNLSQLVAAGHLGIDDTWHALDQAATTAGLPNHEIQNTIRSGFAAGTQIPRIVPDRPPQDIPGVTVLPDAPSPADRNLVSLAGDTGPPLNPILDWHELFAAEDDGEEWIVEPILPARRMVALYSAPKAGKSLLMLEVAVAIARGTEVLGHTPDRPRRVLYVDFENDPRGDIRTRLEAMEVGPDDLDDLCYLTFPTIAKLDTAAGAVDLMRHVEAYQCEVVVIDTVSRAVMGEENDNDTWLAFYRHTGLLLKQHEIACVRLDHSGKDAERGMRGGSAKAGDVDAVWRLTLLSGDTILLECTDHRMMVPRKTLALVRQEFPLAHLLADGGAWQVAADARTREADEALEVLGVATTASVRDAKKALRDAGHKIKNKAIEEAVKLRKMRLDLPPSDRPGDLGGHRGTLRGVSPPETPVPIGGVSGDTPAPRSGTPGTTPGLDGAS